MPWAPAKPCTTCHQLNCTAHKRVSQRQHDALRGSSSKRGYDAQWQRFRSWCIRQFNSDGRVFCESSKGCRNLGTELHHIKRLSDGGERCDPANIQLLCHACHSSLRGMGGRL